MEVGTVLLVVLGAAALAGIRLAVGLRARGAGRQARLRTIERTGKDPADNWFNNSINDWAARHPVGKVVVYVALVAFCVLLGLWSAFN
jgi:hypothetical protein